MPVYGLRPEDVVTDAAGNVQTGQKLTLHATQADAQGNVSPLATVTTSAGRWSVDVAQAPVWVRTAAGSVYEIQDFASKADKSYVDTALSSKLDTTTANSTFVPQWKANTAYAAGQPAVNPSGDVVLAKAAFTSGATYDATKWKYPTAYARSGQPNGHTLGFQVNAVHKGYGFLNFAPNGDIIATVQTSPGGRQLAKSTDSGVTWTTLGEPSTVNVTQHLWFSSAGTWFAHADNKIMRSTDSGVTWTKVCDSGTMMQQSFADAGSGVLWAAEYLGDARMWRSTDDGLTWTVVYNWPNTDNSSGTVIRHLHGVASLPSGLWAYTGDNQTECGFWKWDGSTFVRMSPAVPDPDGQIWRAVGIAERNGWLYWIQDGAGGNKPPAIYKANPANLGGTVTELASNLPTGGWYIVPDDKGRLLCGAVVEEIYGKELDLGARLWAIDKDDTVHEIMSTTRLPDGEVTFTAYRNLWVRPSDGMVGFTINKTDFSPGSQYTTLFGKVKVGGHRLAISRNTVPSAYADSAPDRVWRANPTTSSPQNTTVTMMLIPEMSVTVPSRGRPLLVIFNLQVRVANVGTKGTITLYRNGAVVPAASVDYTANDLNYAPLSFQTVVIPPNFADQKFELFWASSAGGVGISSQFTYRNLTIIEL